MDWETLDMVVRYTRSVKFEDSLQLYQQAMGIGIVRSKDKGQPTGNITQ